MDLLFVKSVSGLYFKSEDVQETAPSTSREMFIRPRNWAVAFYHRLPVEITNQKHFSASRHQNHRVSC